MPFADHSQRRARQQLEILERVTAGETVKAVCARAGMPLARTVSRWAGRDPEFGAALDVAFARGDYVRRLRFDPVLGAQVLARRRAGESRRQIERDPAMPRRHTLTYWMMTELEFGAAMREIGAAGRVAGWARVAERHRALRPAWDATLADRVLYQVGQGVRLDELKRVNPALPSACAIRRWRRERPEFDWELRVNMKAGRLARRRARGKARREAALEPVCAAIVEGASLNQLDGRDGLPRKGTLYAWVAQDRDFAAEVARACDERVHWYADQMLQVAHRIGPLGVPEARRQIKRIEGRLGRLWQRPGKRWR